MVFLLRERVFITANGRNTKEAKPRAQSLKHFRCHLPEQNNSFHTKISTQNLHAMAAHYGRDGGSFCTWTCVGKSKG